MVHLVLQNINGIDFGTQRQVNVLLIGFSPVKNKRNRSIRILQPLHIRRNRINNHLWLEFAILELVMQKDQIIPIFFLKLKHLALHVINLVVINDGINFGDDLKWNGVESHVQLVAAHVLLNLADCDV